MTYVPPPGYTPPAGPPNYPGGPQSPYGSPYGPPPQGRRGNAWGVVSLVFGLLLCVPFLTSLAAAITGVVGVARSRAPNTGGRATSIIGLVLGVLGLLLWGGLTVGSVVAYNGSADSRGVAVAFTQELRAADVDGILKKNPDLDRKSVQAASDRLQDLGNVQTFLAFPMPAGGSTRNVMAAISDDAGKTHQLMVQLADPGGGLRVTGFTIQR